MTKRIYPPMGVPVATASGIALVWLFSAASAAAQDYNRNKPQEPAATYQAAPPPPMVPSPGQGGRQVIVPSLRGLAFVAGAAKFQPKGMPAEGVDAGGIPLLEDAGFKQSLQPYLGKPFTFDDLNAVARLVVQHYQAHDHPLVDVAVPEQDVSSGTVRFVVTEFHVGKVVVEGNTWFSSDQIAKGVRVHPGETVDSGRLLDDVNRLNQNPFRQVDLVYRKNDDEIAATDIVLRTRDRFPLRVYGGYDNTGTPAIGRSRWNLGFNWGNAFWQGQVLSYQFSSSSDFWSGGHGLAGGPKHPSFISHAASWQIPLPWPGRLDIFGVYEQASPRLDPASGLQALGTSWQTSARYVQPLPSTDRISQEMQFGYDFKSSDNNLDFGGLKVFNATTEVSQFVLVHRLSVTDPLGATTLTNTFTYSPGGMTAGNTTAAFALSQPLAKANYFYWRGVAERVTNLPMGLLWMLRITGQKAGGSLLPSEQVGAGGAASVRGYDEYTAIGDNGILVTAELRSPPVSLPHGAVADQTQFIAFYDYGSVTLDRLAPGQDKPKPVASAGIGLRSQIAQYLTVKVDYGFQLRRAPGAAGHGSFGHVAVTVSY